MNELIKVKNENGKQTVLGRDLYEFLEVESNYTTWINRMLSYGFEIDKDYIMCFPKKESGFNGGQNKINHQLALGMAKEISMLQRNSKGKQARLYFIECEQKLKEQPQFKLPRNYKEALIALVEAEEHKEIIEHKLKLQEPKVIYHDNVLNSNRLSSFTEVAKDMGMSAQRLHAKLNIKGYIYKKSNTYHLYQKHIKLLPKYFDYHITEFGQTLKITEKGRKFLIKTFDKED